MVRKDDWKLVLDNYGRGELYNLKADPSEINNLYNKRNMLPNKWNCWKN